MKLPKKCRPARAPLSKLEIARRLFYLRLPDGRSALEVVALTCAAAGVDALEVLGRSQAPQPTRARHACWFALYDSPGFKVSYRAIARAFGRDPKAVYQGILLHEERTSDSGGKAVA